MEFFSCPNLFIPTCVWEFYEEYTYLERHPHTAPVFQEQRPRFVAFRKVFEACMAEFKEAMRTGTEGIPGMAR